MIDKTTFDNLSIIEKRKAIAKDVIARLKSKNLVPINGELVIMTLSSITDSLQTQINNNKCKVCAKGALICSWIGNFNRYEDLSKFDYDLNNRSNYPAELLEIFGRDMLDRMEAAFEGEVFAWCYYHSQVSEFCINTPYVNDLEGIMKEIAKTGRFDWMPEGLDSTL
jgi:hypothetical protein